MQREGFGRYTCLHEEPPPRGVGAGLRLATALLAFTPLAFGYLPAISRPFSRTWFLATLYLYPAHRVGPLAEARPYTISWLLADVVYCALIALVVDFSLRRLSRALPGTTRRKAVAGVATLWGISAIVGGAGLLRHYGMLGTRFDCPGEFAALGPTCEKVREFRHYDLGGLIDREYLAEVRGPPEALSILRERLELSAVDSSIVPQSIWKQSPYWWNPRNGPATRVWASSGWQFEGRGSDGRHYLVLEDVERKTLYLYLKDNF